MLLEQQGKGGSFPTSADVPLSLQAIQVDLEDLPDTLLLSTSSSFANADLSDLPQITSPGILSSLLEAWGH